MNIDIQITDGRMNNWSVETFEITESEARLETTRAIFSHSSRPIRAGKYKRLMRGSVVVMSNTPAEISDHRKFILIAKSSKRVLINGLGLGVALSEILKSDAVESVTVIEKAESVIALCGAAYSSDPRVKIIHADAFEWNPPKGARYDAVWHDIWDYICADNLPEMHKLHRKYGHRADWQGSWCRRLCERHK